MANDMHLIGIFSPLAIIPMILSYVRDKSLPQIRIGMLFAFILIIAIVWMTKGILAEEFHGVIFIAYGFGYSYMDKIEKDLSNLDPWVYGALVTGLLFGIRLIL